MNNWAIIGTGGVAREFSNQFSHKKGKLYAVYSRSELKSEEFAEEFNIEKYFNDYQELLKDKDIDIVYIATPHNTHYQYIKEALEAGKNVLCEKVIVLNSKQLKKCVEIAKDKGLFLAEAMTIHYMPLYNNIIDWINSYNLGPLKVLQINFGSFKEFEDRYFFKKELAGGALFDIGVYALNMARFFMTSKPTEVKTIVNLHESGVDESSGIILKNKEDEIATITLAFRAKLPKRAVIAYERGYVEIYNYPEATKASLVKLNGEIENLEIGENNKRFMHESEMINDILDRNEKNKYLDYTIDVLEIMDEVRSKWNLRYDNEES